MDICIYTGTLRRHPATATHVGVTAEKHPAALVVTCRMQQRTSMLCTGTRSSIVEITCGSRNEILRHYIYIYFFFTFGVGDPLILLLHASFNMLLLEA